MSTTLESFPRLTALEREATTTLLWASTFSFLSTIPPTLLSDGCPENFKILKKSVHYLNRLAFTCTFISPGLSLLFPVITTVDVKKRKRRDLSNLERGKLMNKMCSFLCRPFAFLHSTVKH